MEKEEDIQRQPLSYGMTEYGIDESSLSEEQREVLGKVRSFAQEMTRVYRAVMHLFMQVYRQKNPNFTDIIISRIKKRGYDLPVFSLYGSADAKAFLQNNKELGIDGLSSENFLVNFKVPKPLGRFWYKGGRWPDSLPVKKGEIEWGELYRRSMPIVWTAVDRALERGLHLHRLNEFGQHNYMKYYYLWEAMSSDCSGSKPGRLGMVAEKAENRGELGEVKEYVYHMRHDLDQAKETLRRIENGDLSEGQSGGDVPSVQEM